MTCVFVHGWAMNSAVWDDCIAALPDWIDAIVIDLPGHGTMADVCVGSHTDILDDYVQALVPVVHRPVVWIGWSLGGLAVLRLAELYPQRVAAALLVATNPCFVATDDWSCGVAKAVFDQFAANLVRDQEKTIQRFLALQVKGLPGAMKVVRQLQQALQSRGSASSQALHVGLAALLNSDLRPALRAVEAPLHWSLGGMDGLVPAALASALADDYAQQNIVFDEKASHAPFLSQQATFLQQLLAIAEPLRESASGNG